MATVVDASAAAVQGNSSDDVGDDVEFLVFCNAPVSQLPSYAQRGPSLPLPLQLALSRQLHDDILAPEIHDLESFLIWTRLLTEAHKHQPHDILSVIPVDPTCRQRNADGTVRTPCYFYLIVAVAKVGKVVDDHDDGGWLSSSRRSVLGGIDVELYPVSGVSCLQYVAVRPEHRQRGLLKRLLAMTTGLMAQQAEALLKKPLQAVLILVAESSHHHDDDDIDGDDHDDHAAFAPVRQQIWTRCGFLPIGNFRFKLCGSMRTKWHQVAALPPQLWHHSAGANSHHPATTEGSSSSCVFFSPDLLCDYIVELFAGILAEDGVFNSDPKGEITAIEAQLRGRTEQPLPMGAEHWR